MKSNPLKPYRTTKGNKMFFKTSKGEKFNITRVETGVYTLNGTPASADVDLGKTKIQIRIFK